MDTCWRTAAWRSAERRPTWSGTRRSARRTSASDGPPPRLGLDFHLFWAATTVSLFGDAITLLALPLAAALTLHADAFQMGLLTTAGMLPHLLLYLFVGAWVDRGRRRPFLIGADLGRAILIGLIPLLAAGRLLRMEWLYAIALAAGSLKVAFDVAYSARLQSLLEPALFAAANSRIALSRSASFLAGPGLAGLLVQLVGAPLALLLDAVSFLASGALVGAMRGSEPAPAQARAGLWREIGEGLRFTFGHPILRPFYLATGTLNFFNYVYSAIFVLYFLRELHLQPAQIGVQLAVGGAGGLLGSVLAAPAARRLGLGRACVLGELTFSAGFIAVAGAWGPPWVIVVALSAGSLVSGVGLMLLDTSSSTIFQSVAPPAIMGRAQAASRQLNWGIRPLGALAGGVLGQTLGLHPTIWIAVVGGLCASASLAFTRVRTFHPRGVDNPA